MRSPIDHCPLFSGRRRLAAAITVAFLAAACTQPQRGPVQVEGPQSQAQAARAPDTPLPNRADSLKFAVLGDFGNGTKEQYDTAAQMVRAHQRFPYELVITVGDNIYGSERPQDFVKKFEIPYKPLLDADVKFYASLGNHDSREQRYYKLFNMEGKLYYAFKPGKQNVRFIALESAYLVPEQMAWVQKELEGSREDWKIPYFHHPPYSSGERHGSQTQIREPLEPLFLKHNVSVVFTGHDHIYERVKPQQGIVYFVAGSGGQLRSGGVDRNTGITAVSNATDRVFLLCEISGDQLFFNAVTRTGQIIDSGVITRRK